MSSAATREDLEVITLSEIDKDECHITYMWNLKCDTKELILKKKRDIGNKLMVTKVERRLRKDKLAV